MKQHKHDALIREWLDNGLPQLQSKAKNAITWDNLISAPMWLEDYDYRIVYPPKPKKQIKLLAWFDGDQLFWLAEYSTPSLNCSVRVPAEDKVIEVEE